MSTNPPNQVKSTPINPPSLSSQASSMAGRANKLTKNQLIAIVIWLAGAWMTSRAVSQFGVPNPINVIVGIGLQLVLTFGETPIWRGRGYPKMAVACLIADAAINTGGVWPYAKNLGSWDIWIVVRDIMGNPDITANTSAQFGFAVGLSTFTAAAAEFFWNKPD